MRMAVGVIAIRDEAGMETLAGALYGRADLSPPSV
jgi:hypothetical protein